MSELYSVPKEYDSNPARTEEEHFLNITRNIEWLRQGAKEHFINYFELHVRGYVISYELLAKHADALQAYRDEKFEKESK